MAKHTCPVCSTETVSQAFSAGEEYYCPTCDTTALYETPPNRPKPKYRYEGRQPRECGEHHSTGQRAWCFDCSEWCYGYPEGACRGCEMPRLRDDLEARIKDHEMVIDFVGKEIGLGQPFPCATTIGAVMWLAEYYKEQTVILKQVRELKDRWDKKPGMSEVHDDLEVALEYEEPSDGS